MLEIIVHMEERSVWKQPQLYHDKRTSSKTNTNFAYRNEVYSETTTTLNDNCSETTKILHVETRTAQKQPKFHMRKQELLRNNQNFVCGNKSCSETTNISHVETRPAQIQPQLHMWKRKSCSETTTAADVETTAAQ
jgi:hypothetical protein